MPFDFSFKPMITSTWFPYRMSKIKPLTHAHFYINLRVVILPSPGNYPLTVLKVPLRCRVDSPPEPGEVHKQRDVPSMGSLHAGCCLLGSQRRIQYDERTRLVLGFSNFKFSLYQLCVLLRFWTVCGNSYFPVIVGHLFLWSDYLTISRSGLRVYRALLGERWQRIGCVCLFCLSV